MANNEGTLVIAPIRPQSPDDIFPSAWMDDIKGGWHSVPSMSDRNLIITASRQDGMVCYVEEEQKMYQLIGGIDNENWKTFSPGGADVAMVWYLD